MNITTPPKGDVLDRAFAAYFRSAALEGALEPAAPSGHNSSIERLGDKEYVVLRNSYEVLAVYRVRTSGVLKRLVRWPAELEDR